jgi:Penicillin-insensitive murein endopeptidase
VAPFSVSGVVRIATAVLIIVPVTAATVVVTALAEERRPLADLVFPQVPPPEVVPPEPVEPVEPVEPAPRPERIRWRRSTAIGTHTAGRLVNGVRLPAESPEFFTWDPVLRRSPNRPWRRWGTDRLLRVVLQVARAYHAAHPDAPRMAVGDLSRPRGGNFGPQFGYIGHASHQNGLDVDVYYPRADGRERAPRYASQINRALSQELVNRFLAQGAEVIYVGPNTRLTGPPDRVQALINHDNHLHVRLPL